MLEYVIVYYLLYFIFIYQIGQKYGTDCVGGIKELAVQDKGRGGGFSIMGI